MRRSGLPGIMTALATGAGVGVWRLLVRQSALADERVRPHVTPAPPVREFYGDPADPPLTLAVLGDSSAQGVGVDDFDHTFGGWLGAHLAERGRYVRVVCAAVNGSRAEHLAAQLDLVLPSRPDLAVISTGVNDVRNRSDPRRAARLLGEAVRRLVDAGVVTAVGTTPYIGILWNVDRPLRTIGHLLCLWLEREQLREVVAAGGRPVALGRSLSPLFDADHSLFSPDGFHPSRTGYALLGESFLPVLLNTSGEPLAETSTDRPSGVPSAG